MGREEEKRGVDVRASVNEMEGKEGYNEKQIIKQQKQQKRKTKNKSRAEKK